MPRYLSQHTLACLTRQGAEELTAQLHRAPGGRMRRMLCNMQEGKMFVEFEAESREELERWLAREKLQFDWLVRIEFESREGVLLRI